MPGRNCSGKTWTSLWSTTSTSQSQLCRSTNQVCIIDRQEGPKKLPLMPKEILLTASWTGFFPAAVKPGGTCAFRQIRLLSRCGVTKISIRGGQDQQRRHKALPRQFLSR